MCHFGWIVSKAYKTLYYNSISCASDTIYLNHDSSFYFINYGIKKSFSLSETNKMKFMLKFRINQRKATNVSIIWCWNEIFKHVFVFFFRCFFSVRQIFHDFYWPRSRYNTLFSVCLLVGLVCVRVCERESVRICMNVSFLSLFHSFYLLPSLSLPIPLTRSLPRSLSLWLWLFTSSAKA